MTQYGDILFSMIGKGYTDADRNHKEKQERKEVVMEEFERYRSLLFSIAYRMTGSVSQAEDMVQETYLRSRDTSQSDIRSLKSYLTTIITHLCLDYLKSARVEREQYIGPWLPEPVLTTEPGLLPVETVEQRESISLAFLVLLERLTPPERATFILHEVFDYPFEEVAEIIGKSPANSRQIFHRAKSHLAEQQARFTPSLQVQQHLVARFLTACQSGNLATLTELLAQEVTSWSDGGGKVSAALRPIVGREAVARFWLGLVRKASERQIRYAITVEEVNGSSAVLIWYDGTLSLLVTFDIRDKCIYAFHAVLNPEKLVYIQRQIEVLQNK